MIRASVPLLAALVIAALARVAAAEATDEATAAATRAESATPVQDVDSEMPTALTPDGRSETDPPYEAAAVDPTLPATEGSWSTVGMVGLASLGGMLALRKRHR
jgi:hypothetical protein